MNINTYLDTKLDKEGRSQIFFILTGNGARAKLSTGVKIEPKNWNNGSVKRRETNGDVKNSLLQTKLGILNKIVAEAEIRLIKADPAQIKKEYTSRTKELEKKETISSKHSLLNFIDFYSKQYERIHKSSTLRTLSQVKVQISSFDDDICLEDMKHAWIIGFLNNLVEKGLQDSTIKHRHLKALKLLAKEARKHGITVPPGIDRITWKSTEKQPFFATWEELAAIERLTDFIYPRHEWIRDLFVLSCYTGLRESDLHNIGENQIQHQGGETLLRIVVTKTDLDYAIPLNSTVKKILKKYNYKIPKVSQQEYNREIKTIAQAAKITGSAKTIKSSGNKRIENLVSRHKLFTTHTGRRTFGRRFLDMGGSLIILSKLFGHKNIETTLKYIGYQPNEIVNEFKKVFG